jgi:hypothetical protein
MFKKSFCLTTVSLGAVLCLITGLVLINAAPAAAAPQPQVYYQTPTPGADGRILYVIKEGDSCLAISLLTGVDINTLRELNRLDENCTVIPGQKLLLGVVNAPTSTPGPTETPTPSLPTATPFNGAGQVCVFLFADMNGNSMPDSGEGPIGNGAVSVTDRVGVYSKTGNTTTADTGLCFDDLSEGQYNISVAPPQGFNATTSMNTTIDIKPGDSLTINFGAQASVSQGTAGDPNTQSNSPILALMGAVLVLGGGGLGYYYYIWRLRRQRGEKE